MLLTETQASLIAWGIGGALIAAGVFMALWMLRDDRRGLAGVFLLVAFAGFIFAISRFSHGTRVLLMQGAEASFVKSDLRLYGTHTYSYSDRHTEQLHWLGPRHIIINDTPRPLKLQTVRYGYGLSEIEEIAPFERRELNGIVRHFGPGDAPPAQIDTGEPQRYWVYW